MTEQEHQKQFEVKDQDDEGKVIDTFPTKEMAEARVALLSSQGAHPGRYKIEEKAGENGEKGTAQSMGGADPKKEYTQPKDEQPNKPKGKEQQGEKHAGATPQQGPKSRY